MPHRRLHRSSWVVALASSLVAAVIVLPGEVYSRGGGSFSSLNGGGVFTWTMQAHGWPYRFCHREKTYFGFDEAGEPLYRIPWLSSSAWAVWQADEDEWDFSLGKLIADLLIVAFGVCAVTAIWEWWRRKRKYLFQLRLSELLILVTMLAVAFGWHAYQLRLHREEQEHVRVLEGVTITKEGHELATLADAEFLVHDSCFAPTWLVRLIGEDLLPTYMWRASEMYFDPVDPASDAFEQALPHIKALKCVTTLGFSGWPGYKTYPYSSVSELPQLRTLEIGGTPPTYLLDEAEAEKLIQLQQITTLVLDSPEVITPEAKQLVGEKMPNCSIEYVSEYLSEE